MNAIQYLLSFPWVQPLGWTLIHFLWQGALIGLIASILLYISRRSSPQARYLMACGLLALCVIAPIITFTLLARPPFIFGTEIRIFGNAQIQAVESSSAPVSSLAAKVAEAPGTKSWLALNQQPYPKLNPTDNRSSFLVVS